MLPSWIPQVTAGQKVDDSPTEGEAQRTIPGLATVAVTRSIHRPTPETTGMDGCIEMLTTGPTSLALHQDQTTLPPPTLHTDMTTTDQGAPRPHHSPREFSDAVIGLLTVTEAKSILLA